MNTVNTPAPEKAQTDTPVSPQASPSSAPNYSFSDQETTRTNPSTPAATNRERDFQRAYLLQQVFNGPDHQLAKGKANRLPRAVARELSLTPTGANALRDELVQEGHLRTLKKSGSVVFELTEQGRTLLSTLEQKPIPEGRKPTREGPVSAEVQLARRTFLLFQLFEAEGQTLDQKVANRFREPGRKFLDLKATTANRLRKEMADQGLLTLTRNGRNATYRLNQAGIEFLGVRSAFPETEFAINGRILNELLESARESARQFQPSQEARVGAPTPVPVGASS